MKKLCVFTLYEENGASSKYRVFLYKDELKANFDVKWFCFWNNKYVSVYMHQKKKYAVNILLLYICAFFKRLFQLIFIAPFSDVCFFQKVCIPKFRFNNLKFLKKKGVRIVFDVDDAVYTTKKDYSNDIARLSDVVICGNDNLCNHYKSYNSNVVFLPTVEKTPLFKKFWTNTFKNKTIGWIGSLTTIDNLEIIVNPINKIIEKYPEINFLIISNSPLDYTTRIKNCRFVKWNEKTYISDLSIISVGIMPLKNSEFNRGKCGFKLIQYLNLKKPVVGSDVGVNKEIISSNGIIANTEDEWFYAIERLLREESFYNTFVKSIDTNFFEKYSYEENVKKLICILQD